MLQRKASRPASTPDHSGARVHTSPKGRVKVSPSEIFAFELEVYKRVCREVDTPRSLACYLLATHGEFSQLKGLSFPDANTPWRESSFPEDYLVTEMLVKNPRLPGTNASMRREAALAKFHEAESLCKLTNDRFRNLVAPHDLDCALHVREIVLDALGPLTTARLGRIHAGMKFGPGATSSCKGRSVLLSEKYCTTWGATPRLTPYVPFLKGTYGGDILTVPMSRVTTVPKNAWIDRTIAIEPHANIYYQLGVGVELKLVLDRLGLESRNQSRNRLMASMSVKNGYATIDLSMASDCIAKEVVYFLTSGTPWWDLLWIGRTDFTQLPCGSVKRLEKFSSMGNGFTWELESLIFYAIARSLTKKPIAVFGDDLVVPVEIVEKLFERLNFFGFKPNLRKSFWQGDFRESCGSDWWRGVQVRPQYLRKDTKDIYDLEHHAIGVANRIRLAAHTLGLGSYCDSRLLPAWLHARKKCGKYRETYTSFGTSDEGLIVNLDEARPTFTGVAGRPCWESRVAHRPPVSAKRTNPLGAMSAALDRGEFGSLSITSDRKGRLQILRETRLNESYRGMLHPPRFQSIPVYDWYDLGPWM